MRVYRKLYHVRYIPINDTPFGLHVFWLSYTESRIKLTFSESVSLSHKTWLGLKTMMLLNGPKEMSNVSVQLSLKMVFLGIINTAN